MILYRDLEYQNLKKKKNQKESDQDWPTLNYLIFSA